MATKVSNAWTSANDKGTTAEIEIMGNVKVSLLEVSDLLVVVKNGVVHHSSGKYTITRILDTIVGGRFTLN